MEHAADPRPRGFRGHRLPGPARTGAPADHRAGRRLMTQLFNQTQDIVTVLSFAAGLMVFAPWLIVLLLVALVPAFLGEAHFNAQTYSLDFSRTPERRELDYVRQTAAERRDRQGSEDLRPQPLPDRSLPEAGRRLLCGQPPIALRRAGWGGVFTAVGTTGYYLAYAYIVWRTLRRRIHHRRSHFSRRLVSPPAEPAGKPADGLLAGRRARRSISTTSSRSSR